MFSTTRPVILYDTHAHPEYLLITKASVVGPVVSAPKSFRQGVAAGIWVTHSPGVQKHGVRLGLDNVAVDNVVRVGVGGDVAGLLPIDELVLYVHWEALASYLVGGRRGSKSQILCLYAVQ